MDALFYLFQFQLILLAFTLATLVFVALNPFHVLKKRKWGWVILIGEITVLVLSFWIHSQPKVYPKNYLSEENNRLDTLKHLADQSDFNIGAAIRNQDDHKQYAKAHFNSITVENDLKYGRLISQGLQQHDFDKADAIVDFAIENNLRVRGHALVWGRAADFFKSPDLRSILKDIPKEKMSDTLQYLIKTHITTVLERYKGKITQWDCVNEPLEVFAGGFDENIYYEYIGEEYIDKAFLWANEVDPSVELFLNEQFDEYDSEKAISFIALLEELIEKKVPIHGVGIQAHSMFTIPKIKPFQEFIQKISELGLKVEITELDARLRLFDQFDDPYKAQAEFYEDFCSACLSNPACTGITLWGITDRDSWFDSMGIFKIHQPNEPLLFDDKMNPKPAYYGVARALKNRR